MPLHVITTTAGRNQPFKKETPTGSHDRTAQCDIQLSGLRGGAF